MQCYCDSQPVSCCVSTQESPTGELGDYSFPVEAEANCQASEVELPRSQDRDIAPEDSPGRNVSEESEFLITIPLYTVYIILFFFMGSTSCLVTFHKPLTLNRWGISVAR